MTEANPFAQVVHTPEAIIAQVLQRVMQSEMTNGTPPQVIEELTTNVVRELWSSRVKTFIPVLAVRQVQENLRHVGAGTGFQSYES